MPRETFVPNEMFRTIFENCAVWLEMVGPVLLGFSAEVDPPWKTLYVSGLNA